MSFVFISYMRDDQTLVDRLCESLRGAGIDSWIDRESIKPGQDWEAALSEAITSGSHFIACFSEAFLRRPGTYMRQELAHAARIASQTTSQNWLIPVRLTDVNIDEITIGLGLDLHRIHWADLSSEWNRGIAQIVEAINPMSLQDLETKAQIEIFRNGCRQHISGQISHFMQSGAHCPELLLEKWKDLVYGPQAELLFRTAARLHKIAYATSGALTDTVIEPGERGRVDIVTMAPFFDTKRLLSDLLSPFGLADRTYSAFVLSERRRVRTLPNWNHRDLAHWIFEFEGKHGEIQGDLLYLPSLEAMIEISLQRKKLMEQEETPFLMPVAQIYPTSKISSAQISSMIQQVLNEEARQLRIDEA